MAQGSLVLTMRERKVDFVKKYQISLIRTSQICTQTGSSSCTDVLISYIDPQNCKQKAKYVIIKCKGK
jgi:hypothetical protein